MTFERRITLEDEYKKDTGITPEDIRRLREWLDTQPHLPKDFITELDLILVYHCCNRSAELSKQVLDLHFTLKTLFVCFFKDRIVDKSIERLLNNMLITILPGRTREGFAVLFGHLIDFEPKNLELTPLLKTILMAVDLWQQEEGSWRGLVVVFDLAGVRVGHVACLELAPLRQMLYFVQEALLVKLEGIHLLNAPPFVDKILAIIKPFMKNELLDLLTIHQIGATTLDQYVPMNILPKDCGGQTGTLEEAKEHVLAKMRANKDFFVQENRKRVTESQRPGKPTTMADIFGSVEGSFKMLDID